jgi:hypothetical protein
MFWYGKKNNFHQTKIKKEGYKLEERLPIYEKYINKISVQKI